MVRKNMNEPKLMIYLENEIKKSLNSLGVESIKKEVKSKDRAIDMIINTKEGKTILVEVKSSGEPSKIYQAISQLRYHQSYQEEYLMIAVPVMSEGSKEICKESGIGYIDLTGNVYVKFDKIIIDKVNNQELPLEFISKKKRVKNLFSGNSLRILIEILKNHFKDFTQEEIYHKLKGISQAYINRVLMTLGDGIMETGEILLFLGSNGNGIENRPGRQVIGRWHWSETTSNEKSYVKKTKKYKLTNPKILLNILAKKYNFKDQKIISFYSFEKDVNALMNNISLIGKQKKLDYAFTLHAGASFSAPFVRFEDVYFYAHEEDIKKWAESLDLKRTEFGGNVFLVVPKYDWILKDTQKIKKSKIINNILLYLDLINYQKRGKEQAEFLREKKIG